MMALEDLARFLAPNAPQQMLRILQCFRGGETRSFEELQRETGMSASLLKYYLAAMRRWYLLESRRVGEETRYSLNPGAFKARIITLLVDPLDYLTEGEVGRWKGEEHEEV
jgi:DNA-binding transcriptional ArsR family regulator